MSLFSNLFKNNKPNLLASGSLSALKNYKQRTNPSPVAPSSVTGNPSAVGTQPPTVSNPVKSPVAATPSKLPISGQQYVSTIANKTTSPTTPSPDTPSSDQKNTYLQYLSTVFNPEQFAQYQKQQEQANKRLATIQSRNENYDLGSRIAYENRLDQPGGTVAGAQQAASALNRRAGEQQAYNALEESAAARTAGVANDAYQNYLNLAKQGYDYGIDTSRYADTRADKEYERNKPVSISEGEALYQLDPATGQYKQLISRPKTYAPSSSGLSGMVGGAGKPLSALAQAVQNGTIALDKLGVKERAAVAAELAQSGIQSTRQQTLQSYLGAAQDLINNPNISKISGYIQGKLGLGNLLPGAQLAINQFNQLKGMLSLENREKLKGSGAISDFEFKVLSDAATALGRNLSDAEFKVQLQKVVDVLNGKYAYTNALGGSNVPNESTQVTPSGLTYTVTN